MTEWGVVTLLSKLQAWNYMQTTEAIASVKVSPLTLRFSNGCALLQNENGLALTEIPGLNFC